MCTQTTPKQITTVKVGEHRGKARIWLQGLRLAHAGFAVSERYSVSRDDRVLTLRIADTGERIVSRKKQGERELPVIDLENDALQALFGSEDRVQIIIGDGAIRVELLPKDEAKRTRVKRLADKVSRGEPLSVGSLCAGIGVLDHAIHTGLQARKVPAAPSWAVEMEQSYLQASLDNNPIWRSSGTAIHGRMEDVEPTLLSPVDILIAGLPCTGASRAGKSKNRLKYAEQHETAGSAFVAFLAIVRASNPACVVFENVPDYRNTMSMHVIRDVLVDLGYRIHETILDNSSGALEDRKRYCMVAMTEPLEFAFEPTPVRQVGATLGDILEDVPLDSPAWKPCDYLHRKEERDRAAGKGFRMQIVDPGSTSVGTIGRHYAKWRSTEPLVQHPSNPKLKRLLTPAEHARVKTIPEKLVDGLAATVAHQGLGQSVLHGAFMAVGKAIARSIRGSRKELGERHRAGNLDKHQMEMAI
jgi:DNA (cytosine-5)-methyltransferase 1